VSIAAAFETVRNHIKTLNQQNTDLIFLKSLIESPIVSNLVKVSSTIKNIHRARYRERHETAKCKMRFEFCRYDLHNVRERERVLVS